MAEVEARQRVTYAEYLVLEASTGRKHEYLHGETWAMAGGTPEHTALALAVGGELRAALRGRPCRVYGSDLKVRIEATDLSTYPDVAVVCGALETADQDQNAVTNPLVIVEVLSSSTEAYDRGEKFAHYRRLPSLREYILVSQQSQRLESHFKDETGSWVLREARAGEQLELRALEAVSLDVDTVYFDPIVGSPREL